MKFQRMAEGYTLFYWETKKRVIIIIIIIIIIIMLLLCSVCVFVLTL
jgi:hypothetical protein